MYIKLKLIRRSLLEQTKEEEGIKRFVGNSLILALDLEVGSNIIKTILANCDAVTLWSRFICSYDQYDYT